MGKKVASTSSERTPKDANLARLQRIEGQVRGLSRMVEEDRYCVEVLTQIAAVHSALRAVGKELLRGHLKHCVTDAVQAGGKRAEDAYDELIELMYKNAR